MLDQITPVILTRDEEANIARTLGQLAWAKEVLVIDSFSVDGTVEIARGFANVRIVQREIDSIAGQTVFGIREVKTPWVLMLDADYFVPHEFVAEIAGCDPQGMVGAYIAGFRYAVGGRPLRASLYPARVVLFLPDRVSVWQDGHTPRFAVEGSIGTLRARLIHDDRKSFSRFVSRQRRYMRQEAEKIRTTPFRELPLSGRVRKLVFAAPLAVAFHTLFVRGLVLDGWAGLVYTGERVLAESMLSLELVRKRD